MTLLEHFHFFRIGVLTLSVAVLVLLSGCGGDSGFYEVSGTVQLNGEDVPTGIIVFSPDSRGGNSGAQGAVEISQGKIVQTGHPVIGGPHWIEIQAFDGVPYQGVEMMQTMGKMLLPSQKVQVDLPRSDVELTINMQKQADGSYAVEVKTQED